MRATPPDGSTPPPDGSTRPIDDLFRALAGADALAAFQRLPAVDQDRFIDWINKARDDEAHWRRIDILVLAMRMAPQVRSVVERPPAAPEAVI